MVKKIRNIRGQAWGNFLIAFALILIINVLSESFYLRFDLTKEKRYTLSNSTKELLKKLDDDVYVSVFLEGELPVEYKRLSSAIKDMLNEYRYASGGKINFRFEDLLSDKEIEEKRDIVRQLVQSGVQVEIPELEPDETSAEKYILPSAMVYYKGKEYPLNFLKREFGHDLSMEINGSIELLEAEIGSVLRKCLAGREIKLAFVAGHGELGEFETADIAKELSEFYTVERININISDTNCIKLFAREIMNSPGRESEALIEGLGRRLSTYSGIIVAKPTLPFKEVEKFILDQYIMNGGKVIWLVESLVAEDDSMMTNNGRFMTIEQNHNLGDLLFNYGARLEPTLIQDINCHGIPVISQENGRMGFWPWLFYPLFHPVDDNVITRNLESVWGRYVTTIDTTSNPAAKKRMLLKSSEESRVAHSPVMISLDLLKIKPDPVNFQNPNQVAAVLLEGGFRSGFKHRPGVRRPLKIDFKDTVPSNAMIVIGDGDMIRNQVSNDKRQVYPLGYDNYASRYFNQSIEFANKKFFLNCVDYLCDDSHLIEVRSKKVILRLLDKAKIKQEKKKWQWINMALPIAIIAIFGFLNAVYRRRKWQ